MLNVLLEFWVDGVPASRGSKDPFTNKRTGKALFADSTGKRGKQWMAAVKAAALVAMDGRAPFDGPLGLSVDLFIPRPKSHLTKKGGLRVTAPDTDDMHTRKPDTDKLLRGTQDAMSGIVFRDDCVICDLGPVRKRWAMTGSACVVVYRPTYS